MTLATTRMSRLENDPARGVWLQCGWVRACPFTLHFPPPPMHTSDDSSCRCLEFHERTVKASMDCSQKETKYQKT